MLSTLWPGIFVNGYSIIVVAGLFCCLRIVFFFLSKENVCTCKFWHQFEVNAYPHILTYSHAHTHGVYAPRTKHWACIDDYEMKIVHSKINLKRQQKPAGARDQLNRFYIVRSSFLLACFRCSHSMQAGVGFSFIMCFVWRNSGCRCVQFLSRLVYGRMRNDAADFKFYAYEHCIAKI